MSLIYTLKESTTALIHLAEIRDATQGLFIFG
jgi:hypothetical protein